jgi:integrase
LVAQLRCRSEQGNISAHGFFHEEPFATGYVKTYAKTFRNALGKAEVVGYVRPFHDGRHSSITNAAAAGTSPAALMARAGHSDFATTQLYIELAGEKFRDEAELLERRLWGGPVPKAGTNLSVQATTEIVTPL